MWWIVGIPGCLLTIFVIYLWGKGEKATSKEEPRAAGSDTIPEPPHAWRIEDTQVSPSVMPYTYYRKQQNRRAITTEETRSNTHVLGSPFDMLSSPLYSDASSASSSSDMSSCPSNDSSSSSSDFGGCSSDSGGGGSF